MITVGRLPIITVMVTILTVSSACAVSPPQARPATSSLESAHATRFPHVPPCPPTLGDGPVQRDLTVPFERRLYLLESGEICTPSTGTAFPLSVIPVPPASEETDAADPVADLTDYRGGRR